MSKTKRIVMLFLMVFAVVLVSCRDKTGDVTPPVITPTQGETQQPTQGETQQPTQGETQQPTQGEQTAPTTPEVTYTYALSKTTLTLEVEATEKLEVSVTPTKEISVSYVSSNTAVATVAADGTVTAVSAGEATITATVDGKELTCTVTVNAKPVTYEYALNFESISIQVEQTKKLMVIVDPEKEISPTFVSSNAEVASVSADGTVTGVGVGTATITVTVDDEELSCAVTVAAKPIEYTYAINISSLELELGETEELSIVVTPTPEAAVVPTWTSSNDAVATVSSAGLVTAVGKGEATITATLNGKTYTCAVKVNSDVVLNEVTMVNGAAVNVDLTDYDEELDILYWEHYQESGVNQALNATDLIVSNTITASDRFFGDYAANIGWSNGSINAAWDVNHNGICTGDVVEMKIKVAPNVKQIVVFTGAWRATGEVGLYVNGVCIGSSEKFVAEEQGISRIVTFDISVDKEVEVIVKITPSNLGGGGNVSNPAVVILGEKQSTPSTNVELVKTEMTDASLYNIDLTKFGKLDWYYVNGNSPVSMNDAELIDGTKIAGGDFWDYKASFTWSNGDKEPEEDTNGGNGKCGGSVRVDVKVNSSVKHVYLYAGGYQSNYYVNVINSNGDLIHSEFLHEATGGSIAYQLDFQVNASSEEVLTFIVYRIGGANCSLAAVAVSDADIVYNYSLSSESLEMTIGDNQKLSVSVDPYKVFEVEFVSSNEEIVTVDEDGNVKAVAVGEATITAKIGNVELECDVEVKDIDYSYTVDKEELALNAGDKYDLVVTSNPVKEDIFIVWTSSDNKVVTVDENGHVVAVGKGSATITGTIGLKTVTCEVTVASPIVIEGSSMEDINGKHVDLTNNSDELETLYWEHYQGQGTDHPINATDVIRNNIEGDAGQFGDYKATLGWSNGSNITAWDRNANGKHTNGNVPEIIAEIDVNPSVKQIKLYVGAWNCKGVVTLNINDVAIATSEVFETGGDSIARVVVFDVEITEACTIVAKVTPLVTSGNVSNQAIVLLGEDEAIATTTVEMSKFQIVGDKSTHNYTHIDLTQRGKLDWYYANFDHVSDEMADADYIKSVSHEGNNKEWDYLGAFKWSNGTTYPNSPIDNDNGDNGTNNIRFGGYHNVNVLVNEDTKYIYLYVGGYESTYVAQVIDSKGRIILVEEISNQTSQYELQFAVNATEEEVITIVVYKASGANCSLAAVAVSDVDNTFTLKDNSVDLNISGTHTIEVLANPSQEFEVSYESLNEDVATVVDGLVTAVGVGETKIVVTIGEYELEFAVNVLEQQIEYEYSINEEELALEFGQNSNLEITVSPVKEMVVVWESSNEEVATVVDGLVTAVGAGEATITATVDEQEFTVAVTVTKSVNVISTNLVNSEGLTVNLTEEENLLYWEHYQGEYFGAYGISTKVGATDIIENSITNTWNGFNDYKTKFTWLNGTNLTGWYESSRGICTPNEVTIKVKVNPNVSEIHVYTGAWRATGVVTMYLNDGKLAESEAFTAGDTGIARVVEFAINVDKETEVTIKITPSNLGDSGNVSNPAVLVYGTVEEVASTTSLTMTKTELTGVNDFQINLTEKGPKDWYYSQYDGTTDSMKDGNFIGNVSAGNNFWDYKAAFNWSNGTEYENSPIDNDCNNQGTNNGKCSDFYMSIEINVDETVDDILLYISGWDSTYGLAAFDQNGNVIFNEQIAERIGGNTQAFECVFDVTATKADKITFVVYKIAGSNVGLAAAAVK